MKTYTTTVRVREGEKVSDVDWDYDFRQHFDNYCTNDARRDEICAESVQRFREIADAFVAGKTVRATTYGSWPRCGYGDVIDVGMYDGWPYWKPVPSVFTATPLGGGEWHCFAMLTDYKIAG